MQVNPYREEAAEQVSATEPDWSREDPRCCWDPSRKLLRSIRKYQVAKNRNTLLSLLSSKWHVLWYQFWSVVTGASIPLNLKAEGGLQIPHPNGIVIHPSVEIGPNCLIMQQVTLGYGERTNGVPILGGHVDIGAGAKILGGITLGDHSKVGANAVVLQDVPEGATAVGVPARIILASESREGCDRNDFN